MRSSIVAVGLATAVYSILPTGLCHSGALPKGLVGKDLEQAHQYASTAWLQRRFTPEIAPESQMSPGQKESSAGQSFPQHGAMTPSSAAPSFGVPESSRRALRAEKLEAGTKARKAEEKELVRNENKWRSASNNMEDGGQERTARYYRATQKLNGLQEQRWDLRKRRYDHYEAVGHFDNPVTPSSPTESHKIARKIPRLARRDAPPPPPASAKRLVRRQAKGSPREEDSHGEPRAPLALTPSRLARRSSILTPLRLLGLRRRAVHPYPYIPTPDMIEAGPQFLLQPKPAHAPSPEQEAKAHARAQKAIAGKMGQLRGKVVRYRHRWDNVYALEKLKPDELPAPSRLKVHLNDARSQKLAALQDMSTTVRAMNRKGPTTVGDQSHLKFSTMDRPNVAAQLKNQGRSKKPPLVSTALCYHASLDA